MDGAQFTVLPAEPAPGPRVEKDATSVAMVCSTIMEAAAALLDVQTVPTAECADEIELLAVQLATSLHATLAWLPRPDVETSELLSALDGFLP